jgi:hypothetical protein
VGKTGMIGVSCAREVNPRLAHPGGQCVRRRAIACYVLATGRVVEDERQFLAVEGSSWR